MRTLCPHGMAQNANRRFPSSFRGLEKVLWCTAPSSFVAEKALMRNPIKEEFPFHSPIPHSSFLIPNCENGSRLPPKPCKTHHTAEKALMRNPIKEEFPFHSSQFRIPHSELYIPNSSFFFCPRSRAVYLGTNLVGKYR